MESRKAWMVSSVVSFAGLLCWIIMFLAGHDVWHDVGRPDFWRLAGPPYHDLRVFVVCFYVMFFVLVAGCAVPACLALCFRGGRPKAA